MRRLARRLGLAPADLFLLRELVRRDFHGRYAGSVLGFVWSFAQPLFQLALFSFVFSTILEISLLGERSEHFGVWLFCGLLPWMAVAEGVSRGTTAITDNGPLVKKLRFPAHVLVLSVVVSALLHEAVAAAVFVVVAGALGELAVPALGWLLVAVPLQAGLVLALALVLSAVHVFFRDLAQLLGMVLSAWFYLTPIVYPLTLVPEELRGWLWLNPLTSLVALYRAAFLGGGVDGSLLAALGAVAAGVVLALPLGFWVFRRLSPGFADEM